MKEKYYSEERKRKIIQMLEEFEKVSVHELSKKFNVSEVTIRRDLDDLNSKNTIIRTHGGALSLSEQESEIPVKKRVLINLNEKKSIAKAAVNLVKDGDTILLGGGSTVYQLVKLFKNFKDLKVVTNAIDIALELSAFKDIEILIIGGTLRNKTLSTIGSIAIRNLEGIHVNKLLLSCDGIDIDKGITSQSTLDVEFLSTILELSNFKYLLVDSSKFGKIFLKKITSIPILNKIITDKRIDPAIVRKIEALGVEVLVSIK